MLFLPSCLIQIFWNIKKNYPFVYQGFTNKVEKLTITFGLNTVQIDLSFVFFI